jgi:seryl-tRNA(Sec) selenium transferase
MADQPATRLGAVETDIKVLQANESTTAKLLVGIAKNQEDTVSRLESLRLSQYPPFTDVMRTAGVVIMIFGSMLTGLFWLIDARISEKTRLAEYRLAQIENHMQVSASWKNTTVVEKIPR